MPKAGNVRIVLVRPRNPLNIGAAARAAANFGIGDLVVVAPHAPVWEEARTAAVGAEDLLKKARAVPALAEALADRTFVVGTTTGKRRTLPVELVPLAEARVRVSAKERVALIFGSEKTGLGNEDFSHCHLLARIPTGTAAPSMNLGQAVAVACYEWVRTGPLPGERREPGAPAGQVEQFLAEWHEVLRDAGYFSWKERPSDILKLRQLLRRLDPAERDLTTLRGMFAQIRWKLADNSKL